MLIDLKKFILNCYAFILRKNLYCSYVLLLDVFKSLHNFFVKEKYLDAMKNPSVSSLMTGLICFNIW